VTERFDLARSCVHLGRGPAAVVLPDFEWTADALAAYRERFAGDGDQGRLVCVIAQEATWDSWERHPAGEEVVVLLSGRIDLVQEIDGEAHVVPLRPGDAVINPANVWHTAFVHEPGSAPVHHARRGNGGATAPVVRSSAGRAGRARHSRDAGAPRNETTIATLVGVSSP
jgi:mannose-6-phosphate isomerase-like protein (cupin superfamily)